MTGFAPAAALFLALAPGTPEEPAAATVSAPASGPAPGFLDRAQAQQAVSAQQPAVANALVPGTAPASAQGAPVVDVDKLLAEGEALLARASAGATASAQLVPDAKPADAEPADAKPTDARPTGAKPIDTTPAVRPDPKADTKQALLLFQRALAAAPKRAAPLWALSRAYDALGDKALARHYADLVVRSQSNDKTPEMASAAAWRLELPQ